MQGTARDVMQSPVRTVRPEMSLADLEREFLDAGVSGFPVVDGGKLVGVVTRSDVVRRLAVEQNLGEMISERHREARIRTTLDVVGEHVGQRLQEFTVRDVMIPDPICIVPDEPLVAVAQRMMESRVHRLPVVEAGEVVGIVSSVDFVRRIAEEGERPA